jgi:hypothetical protein
MADPSTHTFSFSSYSLVIIQPLTPLHPVSSSLHHLGENQTGTANASHHRAS